ncbi:MAG: hypothetical protein QXG00_06090 [Candidatus Woesearchaeota archaeon]
MEQMLTQIFEVLVGIKIILYVILGYLIFCVLENLFYHNRGD